MKKIIALVLAFALALSFTACGGTAAQQGTDGGDKSAAGTQQTYTETQVIEAANELYAKANEYMMQGDYENFAALFVNTDEATVKAKFENMNYYKNYDQHFAVYVCDGGGLYHISFVDAIASGVYPNTSVSRSWMDAIITPAEDGWKFDFGVEALDAQKELLWTRVSSGMQEAHNAGRNATFFNYGNFMHFDTSLYVEGIFDANIMELWQDAEGNLCIGVLYNNGTDGNRAVTSATVKISDQNAGMVFQGELGSENVLAGSSKYVIYTVPAAQVLTGTAQWGPMSYSLSTRNV